MKHKILVIFGLLIAIGCFAISLRGTTLSGLGEAFRQADYRTLPVLLLLLAGFYLLKTLRWSWLLAPTARLTVRQLLPPMLIGFGANNLLPAHLGEFVRVYELRRRYGISPAIGLSTVVLERVFDVLAILALFATGVAFSPDLPPGYHRSALVMSGGAFVVVLGIVAYLIWTEWFLGLAAMILRRTPYMPSAVTEKLVGMLRTGADGLASLRSGRMVAALAANSLAQWLLNGMIAYVSLRAFGIPVTPAAGLIVTGVTAAAVTIPSTPGYFGVIQACFQISMRAQAENPPASLVFGASIYYQLSMFIPVTCLGLFFLLRSGQHLSDLRDSADRIAGDDRAEPRSGLAQSDAAVT